MKLCIITCYKQPDYVRAITLRAAAASIPGIDVIVVKNRHKGLLRYGEVFLKLLRIRITDRPDAYLLTFRGYEMLVPVRLLTMGKPLAYDEFINPIEWASYEHKKISPRNPVTYVARLLYGMLLHTVNVILTDTESHTDLSAELTMVPRRKFISVPVGTDETTFATDKPEDLENPEFTVFYYGNMLPLHGLKYVIDAAVAMNHEPVKFVLIGGNAKTAHDVAFAVGNGANIEYYAWVDYERLPAFMRTADLCLAGPFGNTFQSQYVITGKAYQYLAMGRPTVIGANKESHVFRDQHDALIVRQGSTAALVDAIRWAMKNQAKLHRIGKAGQALYKKNYSTEHIAEKLRPAIDRLGPS